MTPDDARKLLGGYATGSLTEAERTALFQAALEDQELFEELAAEQALKEVLDEPGARQRLITALEPPRRYRAWLWATAAATMAVAVVIGVVVSQRTPPPPQQIAQVLKSPEPVAPPAAPPVPAPVPPPAPVKRKAAPPAEVKEEADQIKPQAFGAVGGAPAAAAARAENMAAKVPGGFAFNYAVRADRSLEIVPAARGFLSVSANDTDIFPSGAVSAGTPVRIPIPAEASSLIIAFSGMPGGATSSPVRRNETSGTATDQDPPNERILIQLSLTPATR